jgi:1,4-dihydroxy-2-naphthoate octaprenyltransferase
MWQEVLRCIEHYFANIYREIVVLRTKSLIFLSKHANTKSESLRNRMNVSNWILAARPKTFPAAVIPVFVGSSLAYYDGYFDFLPAFIALFCALLIQIGTNFANDYYDYKKGTDAEHRIGFQRATSSGLISEQAMFKATYFTMGIAFLCGLYLVWHAGWIVLVIGVVSLLFGILYTGGPYPLGYNGLGDVFVFVFLKPFYYLQQQVQPLQCP